MNERVYREKSREIFKEAEYCYDTGLYAKAGTLFRILMLFNHDPYYMDVYKDKGRDILSKAVSLYYTWSYKDACALYEQAIKFDPSNIKVSVVRGESLGQFADLKKSLLSTVKKDTEVLYWEEHQLGQESEEIDFGKLMLEGYDGRRKKVSPEMNTADPDNYDLYYNQYEERDLGDEIEEYFERQEDL